MSQTTFVLEAIKIAMRKQGVTFSELATALSLGERGLKKAFADQSLTLLRIERICDHLGLSLQDLIRDSEQAWHQQALTLSGAQEDLLAGDEQLFVIFHLLLHGMTFHRITDLFDFEKSAVSIAVRKLEKAEILTVISDDRIRMHLSRAPIWREKGPLETTYGEAVAHEFILKGVAGSGYKRLVMANLTARQYESFVERIQRLEFELMVATSDTNADGEAKESFGFFHVVQPWEFSVISKYRRLAT